VYGIIDFNGDNYVYAVVVYALCLWVYERIAQLLSISFDNPLIGMLLFLNFWFSSFLFGGFVVAEQYVIWPFRAFFTLLPVPW
jgi:hypothetical protein